MQYENLLAQQLSAIRASAVGAPIDARLAAETTVHLAVRNAHIRDAFENVGVEAVAAVSDLFSDEKYSRQKLGVDQESGGELRDTIRKAISERFPTLNSEKRELIEKISVDITVKQFTSFFERQRPQIEQMVQQIGTKIEPAAKQAHAKALSASLAPEKRVDDLSKFCWQTLKGKFVLPDSVAVSCSKGRATPYMIADTDEAEAVFMPVSAQCLLAGFREAQLIEGIDFNRIAAECSGDFFIATERNELLAQLIPLIGNATQAAIRDAVDSAKAERRASLGILSNDEN